MVAPPTVSGSGCVTVRPHQAADPSSPAAPPPGARAPLAPLGRGERKALAAAHPLIWTRSSSARHGSPLHALSQWELPALSHFRMFAAPGQMADEIERFAARIGGRRALRRAA